MERRRDLLKIFILHINYDRMELSMKDTLLPYLVEAWRVESYYDVLYKSIHNKKEKDLPPNWGLNYSSMVVYADKSDLQTRNVINIRRNVIYYELNSPRLFPDI